MAIPLSQLSTWSNQGATVTSKQTHESVRNALEHSNSPLVKMISNGTVKVYLQGSYKNDTNVRGDSDVDIIVELTNVFSHNIHERSKDEQDLHSSHYSDAVYTWDHLRRDTQIALERYYGAGFVDGTGNKSIKLLPNNGRLKADVVPVVQHRAYNHFYGPDYCSYELGVKFNHKTTGKKIINYPEHHFKNGASKHQNTQNQFKPVVRIIKNARNYLFEKGLLEKGKAPSYFLQSLIYNVPNSCFVADLSQTVKSVLQYLYTTPIDNFICQNGIIPLFGNTEEQWNVDEAIVTIVALVNLWDNWYEI